ncbi:MAG: nickel/cobalt transporter [Hyphomicrobiales bacterium]
MIKNRFIYNLILASLTLFLFFSLNEGGVAQQKSPFGVTAPQAPTPVGGGFLRENLSWIYQQQAAFYKSLTGVVKQAKEDGNAVWLLMGLSFLYGIFHAAGPGHGKVVISSYVLANEQSAKRGMIISFLAAFMQGVVAVVLIGAAVFVFNLTSFAVTEATHWFERASYALIAMLGVYLLWQKGVQPFLKSRTVMATNVGPIVHEADCHHHEADCHHHEAHDHHHHDHVHSHSHGHSHSHDDHHHGHHHGHDHGHSHSHGHDHDHDHDCSCGGHAVDPSTMQEPLSLRSAWAAIISVGLRPCSGALIVLVFASAQGLFLVGVASTFAMALGTAITVTTLATIALWAKGLATRYLTISGSSGWMFKTVELFGASLVFLLGITLLAASFQG